MNTESFVLVVLRFTGLAFLLMFLYNFLDLAISIRDFFNIDYGLVFGGTETSPIRPKDLEEALFKIFFKKIVNYILMGLAGYYLFFKGARVHQMIMNQIPKI